MYLYTKAWKPGNDTNNIQRKNWLTKRSHLRVGMTSQTQPKNPAKFCNGGAYRSITISSLYLTTDSQQPPRVEKSIHKHKMS